jgi:hypothetical protein
MNGPWTGGETRLAAALAGDDRPMPICTMPVRTMPVCTRPIRPSPSPGCRLLLLALVLVGTAACGRIRVPAVPRPAPTPPVVVVAPVGDAAPIGVFPSFGTDPLGRPVHKEPTPEPR